MRHASGSGASGPQQCPRYACNETNKSKQRIGILRYCETSDINEFGKNDSNTGIIT